MGQGTADILIWNPGLVTGTPGTETIPGTASFSCAAQRLSSGIATQGKITSRAEELAGPDTVPGGGVTNGYTPCVYAAPSTGIYSIAVVGPAGIAANADGGVGADIALISATDFSAAQGSSIAAWDVTVRELAHRPVNDAHRARLQLRALTVHRQQRPAGQLDDVRGDHRWIPLPDRSARDGSQRLGGVREPARVSRPGRNHAALPQLGRRERGESWAADHGAGRRHLCSPVVPDLLHAAVERRVDGARHSAGAQSLDRRATSASPEP